MSTMSATGLTAVIMLVRALRADAPKRPCTCSRLGTTARRWPVMA